MNTITIELSAEDRARLDKLTAALEQAGMGCTCKCKTEDKPAAPEPKAKKSKPEKAAETPTEVADEPTPITDIPAEEKPAETTTAATTVTLEQIQQKVVQLAAGNGGAKKAQVREIISAYGAKVSDLKEQPDKWDEVWAKLTALESEG